MHALTFRDTQFDVVDQSGQPWLRGYQIGTALGYTNQPDAAVRKIFDRNADEFTSSMTALVELDTAGGKQQVRIFSLRGVHLLAMLSRTKVAKEFRRWVLDVLEGIAEAPAKTKRQPKALPNGLTIDQQSAIKGLVKARAESLPAEKRAKAVITCWSALKSKFGCTYKEIPPDQFTDAIGLVARLVLDGEYLPAQPALNIHYPLQAWLDSNPGRFGLDAETGRIGVTINDLVGAKTSPCLDLLDQLSTAGYDIRGAFYEFRAHQNVLFQIRSGMMGALYTAEGLAYRLRSDFEHAYPMLVR